ncbi:MAG: hypothetical protein ORN49_14375, partial [Rhodobacteraceae bacterium]|nr:hypothetical protein [Paracoccaceae bacterium]
IQAGSILLIAAVMTFAGRLFGGGGRFMDGLLLVVWLEFILTVFAAIQFLTLLALPVLGVILSLLSIPLFLWLLVSFAAALHGFRTLLWVLLGMVGAFVLTVVVLAFVMALLGIDPRILTPV